MPTTVSTAKCHKCKDTGATARVFYSTHNFNCTCPAGMYLTAEWMCSTDQLHASIDRTVAMATAERKARRAARRAARTDPPFAR